tara:strand:+ start:1533 stop:1760 length:228 start_codon:yes stop_codon:yes gene_type:complete
MLQVNVTHYIKSEKVSIQVGKDPSTKTYDIGCKLLSGRLLNILRASSTCNIKVEEKKFHGQIGDTMVGDRPLLGF